MSESHRGEGGQKDSANVWRSDGYTIYYKEYTIYNKIKLKFYASSF